MSERETRAMRLSFGPTTGVITGVIGLVIVLLVTVGIVWQERSLVGVRVLLATLAAGVVVWAYLLRPRVVLEPQELLLRNAFVDTSIPYTAVEDVVVRSVTRVRAGGKAYAGLAVGHPTRRLMKQSVRAQTAQDQEPEVALNGKLAGSALPDYVQDQILERVTLARRGAEPTGEVTREPAVAEIVLAAGFLLAFVVALFL